MFLYFSLFVLLGCLFVFCFIICFVLISAVCEHTLLNHYITMLENTEVCNKLPVYYLLFDVNMYIRYEMLYLMDPGLLSNV
jgi:hypothetical protein